MKTVSARVIGANELTVSKWADKRSDGWSAAWAALGAVTEVVSNGWFGWGPDVAEPRWLVQVRDLRTDDIRTVQTTFTKRGASRGARRVAKILESGNEAAIANLPDYLYADNYWTGL